MATKNNPGEFDCYTKLEPDEPYFLVKSTDPLAPVITELWASLAELKNGASRKVTEARECAASMRQWRRDQLDGELQSRASGTPSDAMGGRDAGPEGNPSSSALPTLAGRSSAPGPEREPVTADSEGQPSADEASRTSSSYEQWRIANGWEPTNAAMAAWEYQFEALREAERKLKIAIAMLRQVRYRSTQPMLITDTEECLASIGEQKETV